jgi:hypothetical protein
VPVAGVCAEGASGCPLGAVLGAVGETLGEWGEVLGLDRLGDIPGADTLGAAGAGADRLGVDILGAAGLDSFKL